MGNCQAIDNATLVIQHPNGRPADKLYHSLTASEVMKSNPGHFVALLLTTTTFSPPYASKTATDHNNINNNNNNIVRVTRIKLLRPTDMLILGQVYRLLTNQEVMKGLSAKKYAKMKKNQELGNSDPEPVPTKSEREKNKQVQNEEKHQPKTAKTASSGASAKSKHWKPRLNSISESTS